ncbi:MAG: aminopeptidase [Firmicutes bacterium HGW-Firmicutes-13]|nr:MAG: aminopeptidase [Firmicutes bacterium HGW-Firmicutes-13]
MEIKEFLEEISTNHGISGHESRVTEIVAREFRRYSDELYLDPLGNVIALKKGKQNHRQNPLRIMLAAHMDEIGLLVSKIEKGGFLRVSPVGGIDPRSLLNQEVIVHAEQEFPGVIGAKSPHILEPEELEKGVKMEKLYIDLGFPEEKVREKVSVGDLITIRRDFVSLTNDCAAGKALDDRAGVAVVLKCLQELQMLNHEVDIYAVATVQEEVGVRGAIVSAFGVAPQIGIAIDVTHGDMPGVPEYKTSTLGKGTVITSGPNIHPFVYDKLVKAASEYHIPYQTDTAPGPTGTDAWALQITREGVATGLVSIPLRYMHTSVELLSMEDIKSSARLLAQFAVSIKSEFIEELMGCY